MLLEKKRNPVSIVSDKCHACGVCLTIGCPALGRDAQGMATIDPVLCIGCGQCAQDCPFGCIEQPTLSKEDMR